MNRHIVLFICFILSLLFVTYEDNSDIRDVYYEESVSVFYDIENGSNIVENPDTGDINIYVYFVVLFYSFLNIIVSFDGIKKVNKFLLFKN